MPIVYTYYRNNRFGVSLIKEQPKKVEGRTLKIWRYVCVGASSALASLALLLLSSSLALRLRSHPLHNATLIFRVGPCWAPLPCACPLIYIFIWVSFVFWAFLSLNTLYPYIYTLGPLYVDIMFKTVGEFSFSLSSHASLPEILSFLTSIFYFCFFVEL